MLLLLVPLCTAYSCPDIIASVAPMHYVGGGRRERMMATAKGRTEAARGIRQDLCQCRLVPRCHSRHEKRPPRKSHLDHHTPPALAARVKPEKSMAMHKGYTAHLGSAR